MGKVEQMYSQKRSKRPPECRVHWCRSFSPKANEEKWEEVSTFPNVNRAMQGFKKHEKSK